MKGDAALACLDDWTKLCLAMGCGLPETDPAAFRQLSDEFYAKARALSSSDIEALEQLATAIPAWLRKVEETRLGGVAGDPRLRRAPDGNDWIWRPVVAGMCHYKSLFDGTLGLEDIALMNTVLDVVEENKRITAGDAAAPQETPDLAAALDDYIREQRVHGREGSQNGFVEWVRIRKSTYPALQVFDRDELRAAFKTRSPRRRGRPPKK
jgi:hypothetical protein